MRLDVLRPEAAMRPDIPFTALSESGAEAARRRFDDAPALPEGRHVVVCAIERKETLLPVRIEPGRTTTLEVHKP